MSDADDRTRRNAAPDEAEKWPRALRGAVALVLAVVAWAVVIWVVMFVWRSL